MTQPQARNSPVPASVLAHMGWAVLLGITPFRLGCVEGWVPCMCDCRYPDLGPCTGDDLGLPWGPGEEVAWPMRTGSRAQRT